MAYVWESADPVATLSPGQEFGVAVTPTVTFAGTPGVPRSYVEPGTETLVAPAPIEPYIPPPAPPRAIVPFWEAKPALAAPLAPEPGIEMDIVAPPTQAPFVPFFQAQPALAAPVALVAGVALIGTTRIIAALALRMGIKAAAAKAILLNILKTGGLIVMWEFVEELLGIDRQTAGQITEGDLAPRRKRYSIGHNPRVRTLQRVARHTMRLLKRHEKVIREFLPKKTSSRGELAARERAHHRLIGKAVD